MTAELQHSQATELLFSNQPFTEKHQNNWDKQWGSSEDLVNGAVDKEQIERILKLTTAEFLSADHS